MRDNEGFGRLVAAGVVLLGVLGPVVGGGALVAAVVSGHGALDAGVADGVVAGFRLPGHLTEPAVAWLSVLV